MTEHDKSTPAETRFLNDVRNHQMAVLRDDGVNRHIRFKRPDSSAYYFDIITWPGKLCISGDCGTWVFARVEDMFNFFRTKEDAWNFNRAGGLSINPAYWSEKLLAHDGRGRARESGPLVFSNEIFEKAVADYVDQATEEWTTDRMKAVKAELTDRIEDEVLYAESEEHASRLVADFEFQYRDQDENVLTFRFADFWEVEVRDWTFGFIWNLYAIVWGIRQYDTKTAPTKAAA